MIADNNRLKSNANQFELRDKEQRSKNNELNRQLAESEGKLRASSKEKSNIQAELEAEKQVCQTKKRAVQIATEELSKNHETIKQQTRTIEKMKKSIDWRTLVMLRMYVENEPNLMEI